MGRFYIFIIRLILSGILALLICRMFFKETPLFKVIGLAVIMLGLAYLFDYTKKRDKGGENET